ncbi:MAG: MFS transporter [Acidimicrobiales bacterium]|nr:MFS transporter [Acidimicrobiales bacterium]MCB1014089.1 MFS transporter [Acidimicrobiales bacterium]MCB9373179.1 MFS transporter [Microthrixaceae bacterium]
MLAVASVAGFAGALDLSMLFVAYPAIADAFPDTSPALLSWVVTVYSIVLAALLIPSGRLADRLGRRRVFLTGIAVFGVGALASGLAPGPLWLIAARAGQAVGGALILPASMGILLTEFPDSRRGTAIGAWGGVGGLATVAGPAIGSALLAAGGWRWVLLVNVPLALVAFVGGSRAFRESTDPGARLTDVAGSAMLAVAVAGLALGITQGPERGWADPVVLGSGAVAVGAALALVRRSRRQPDPVLDLELLGDPLFRAANLVAFTFSAAFFAMFFGVVLFVTEVWHEPHSRAGLYVIPAQVTAATTSFLSGKLADRRGHRRVMVPGALAFAAGSLVLLVAVEGTDTLGVWIVALVLMGAGIGTVFPSFQSGAVHAVASTKFGIAAATTQTNSRVAGTLGVAAAVALVGSATTDEAGSFDALWVLLAGLAVVSAAASWRVDTRARHPDVAPAIP